MESVIDLLLVLKSDIIHKMTVDTKQCHVRSFNYSQSGLGNLSSGSVKTQILLWDWNDTELWLTRDGVKCANTFTIAWQLL